MKIVLATLGWLAGLVLALMAFAMFSLGGRVQCLLLAVACLAVLPPVRRLGVPRWARAATVVLMLAGVVAVTTFGPKATSIYRSPAAEQAFHDLYEAKLADWPVPHEDVFVETRYGDVHVIVSGPEDAPPVLLVNASAMAAWSWKPNVAALAASHRVYAIDNIGEVGLNRLDTPGNVPKDGPAIAAFYTGITDKLGIGEADVVGASVGGYIATMYALHAPERVRRLVLLGSMGFGATRRTILLMTLAQAFPLRPVQDATLAWALGDDPAVAQESGDWFRLVLNGSVPTPIPPRSLTPEELSRIRAPTLAFFGTRDAVVGDAEAATALARNIPDIEIVTVASGHLIGAEVPEEVNPRLAAFLAP